MDGEGSRRSRRDKKKGAAFETLAKLKHSRETGEKLDVEIKTDEGIFEYVDDKEYSRILRKRQADNWVLDDAGLGYVDSGREVFDEDYESDEEEGMEERGEKEPNSKKRKKGKMGKSSIKDMLLRTKPKNEENVTLDGDDLLGDCLDQLSSGVSKTAGKVSDIKFRNIPKPKPATQHSPAGVDWGKAPSSFVKMRERPTWTPPTSGSRDSPKMDDQAIDFDDTLLGPELDDGGGAKGHTKDGGGANGHVRDVGGPDGHVKKEVQTFVDDEFDFTDDMMDASCADVEGEGEVDGGGRAVKKEPQQMKYQAEEKAGMWDIGWETVKGQVEEKEEMESVPSSAVGDSSQLPLREENGEVILPFFWLDAYEDPFNQPGTVFLFGKVKAPNAKIYSSCCVQVRNIDRCVYLLPREKVLDRSGNETEQDVTMKDIYEEFNTTYAVPYKIMRFSSKRVEKKYAFEKTDVPATSEYLEVKYSAQYRALPANASGLTFSHAFGTNTSSIERLILSQQIKGPCWLALSTPGPSASVSWCKFECVIASPDKVKVMTEQPHPPPLVVVSVSTKTVVNPKTNTNELLALGVLQHNAVSVETPPPGSWEKAYHSSFCGVRRLPDQTFPYDFTSYVKSPEGSFIEAVPTERALLGYFLAKLHKIDPDVIVGHRISDFDLDVLVHRMQSNKVPNWSRISRLKRTAHIKGHMSAQQIACGRLVCDTNISSKELIRARSYDLTTLAHQVLRFAHPSVTQEEVVHAFGQTKTLRALIAHTMNDALVSLGIMVELNILPLAYQITKIAGNLFSRTLLGGRSERNEYLLLHAFTATGYICPDKPVFGRKSALVGAEEHDEEQPPKGARRKAAYSGGLVLEPKKGFYDSFILLLDFNSLYPSIIQEYNIDFTTVPQWQLAIQDPDRQLDPPGEAVEPGILPTEIRILVQRRREVKNLMKNAPKNSDQHVQLDIRQKALKLTANSMYGCLGFSHSRFYAQPLAALITGRGREILSHTKDLVEKMNLEVIYGDTDSIMINTNSREFGDVMELGQKVKAEVNKFYRLVELDIDGVFKTMLLLKKKKYAAISVTPGPPGGPLVETMEMKGLDIVRRDWCDLAKETGEWVLQQILSSEAREDLVEKVHEHLQQIGERVTAGQVPLAKFIITKSLTKPPESYPDAKSLPHVLVAQRLISKGTRVQAGDVVPYVICCNTSEGTPSTPAVQRAFHPREVEENKLLTMDTQYYLQQQVHAVVTRLCEPIEGTDAAQIAHCLGLDPSHFRSSVSHEETDAPSFLPMSREENADVYKDCEPLQFACLECKSINTFSADSLREKDAVVYTRRCQHCNVDLPLGFVCVRVQYAVRKQIQKCYAGWLKCEDPACGFRTRVTPVHVRLECRQCKQGHLRTEFTPMMLYNQLCFYKEVLSNKGKTPTFKEAEVVQFYLSKSDYSKVNLDQLFSGLSTTNA